MGRFVLHWVCVCALVALLVGGCSDETTGTGGTGGSGGAGGMGGDGGTGGIPECANPDDCDDENECTEDTCADGVCEFAPAADDTACGDDAGTCQQGSCRVACDEQGIRNAIAAGGGPYTFDCDGATTVVTDEARLEIDNDVILDGEGNLTIDAGGQHGSRFDNHCVFSVARQATAELRGLTVTGGFPGFDPDGYKPDGCGIYNGGTLTLTNSTVSGNTADTGGGIWNSNGGTLTNSIIDGDCGGDPLTSSGYNIESPGDTCGFDQPTDQAGIMEVQLDLGPLQDNGGPTMTHALGGDSVAIDKIPADMCEVDEDQRGEPRDSMCDVGAFEVQP